MLPIHLASFKQISQEVLSMESTQMTPEMETLKSKLRATWTAGDFAVIAKSIEAGAAEFVNDLGIKPGMSVLDVACGSGNLAIPAAKAGAHVTGIDLAPSVIEHAKQRADAEGVDAKFEVGDAEALPYDDDSFDAVITMFGAMFAPRPDVTAEELIRVCKPGGLIAMANWTPESFVGDMFRATGKHVPPPAGMPSPLLWGKEEEVETRLGGRVSDLRMVRRNISFDYSKNSPAEVVELFREFYGPTNKAFGNLDEAGQAALRNDLEELWSKRNRATDGTVDVESEYLDVRAVKP
jgi:SAM-dependent methyltransferase